MRRGSPFSLLQISQIPCPLLWLNCSQNVCSCFLVVVFLVVFLHIYYTDVWGERMKAKRVDCSWLFLFSSWVGLEGSRLPYPRSSILLDSLLRLRRTHLLRETCEYNAIFLWLYFRVLCLLYWKLFLTVQCALSMCFHCTSTTDFYFLRTEQTNYWAITARPLCDSVCVICHAGRCSLTLFSASPRTDVSLAI